MFDSHSDRRIEGIPRGLDRMEPGPVLAAFLSAIDVATLSGRDRIVVLRAHQRMASHYTARTYEDMASVTDFMVETDDYAEFATEAAAAEIRAALRLTRRAADSELSFALELKRRLPRVWSALAAGDIDLRRARTITNGTAHLSEDDARQVVDRVIDQASRLTTGQLAARIRRLCIASNPHEAAKRYTEAIADRRVVTSPTEAGTANLYGIDLPPHRAAAALSRINRIARELSVDGEARTMDQIRADVLLDLLEGCDTQMGRSSKGTVDIHVDLTTLAELVESPAELAGYGPVIADIARQVTQSQQSSEWRVTVTHPTTGDIVHTGTTRRRPSSAQTRDVHAMYRTCVFPGCRMPATGCDLDHRVPWSEGGPTTVDFLAPLCRHDHVTRHRGWTYVRLGNGDHEWTSALGHTYIAGARSP